MLHYTVIVFMNITLLLNLFTVHINIPPHALKGINPQQHALLFIMAAFTPFHRFGIIESLLRLVSLATSCRVSWIHGILYRNCFKWRINICLGLHN